MGRRVTSSDVAKMAGVSRSAVSRTFTPGASVATETRRRVVAAATQLGYRRNALASGLTKNRTDMIAVVMRDMSNPFEAHLFTHLSRGLRSVERRTLLVTVFDDEDVGPRLLHALDYPVEAAIVAAGSVSSDAPAECMKLGIPLVLCGRTMIGGIDSVCCENEAGVEAAAEALVRAGHERIAYIGGPVRVFSESERAKAFRAALAGRGLSLHAEAHGNFHFESGHRAALSLLRRPDPPDAIFCCNDAMAMGAIDAARHTMGLRVPADLSVIGFDDVPMAAWPAYQLTTVRIPIEAMVEGVIDLLQRRIAQPEVEPEARQLSPVLVRRSSARLLPAAAPVSASDATRA